MYLRIYFVNIQNQRGLSKYKGSDGVVKVKGPGKSENNVRDCYGTLNIEGPL